MAKEHLLAIIRYVGNGSVSGPCHFPSVAVRGRSNQKKKKRKKEKKKKRKETALTPTDNSRGAAAHLSAEGALSQQAQQSSG
jgi:hypothetical protein